MAESRPAVPATVPGGLPAFLVDADRKPRLSPPSPTTHRTREFLSRAALVVASVTAAFAACEALVGLVAAPAGSVLNVYNRANTVGLDCYPTNPDGYFDLDLRDPATRQRYDSLRVRRVEDCAAYAPHAVEFQYNSLQFREREPGPRAPGVRRVAVLGDSFTEGQGVKEADTYVRGMERALRASAGGEWEVLNFGRRGADFPALDDTFRELLRFDPDVVVYALTLNDCEPSPAFRDRHAWITSLLDGPRQKVDLIPNPIPFGSRTALFVRHRVAAYRRHRAMTRWYDELYAEPNRDGWAQTQALIEGMHRQMLLRGGRFLLAAWPVLANLDRDYSFRDAHQTIARFCHSAGIAWIDLLPVLEGHTAQDLWVHPQDPHPNALAHRLVADSLASAVIRETH
jgi:lysophospholipase L1-like esterase